MNEDVLFEVPTSLGFSVRVTYAYWELIANIKHPVMCKREMDVQDVLQSPDEIRRSIRDPTVFLFYQQERPGRWICAVVKQLNGEGFLITAYPTDGIKEGEQIWRK